MTKFDISPEHLASITAVAERWRLEENTKQYDDATIIATATDSMRYQGLAEIPPIFVVTSPKEARRIAWALAHGRDANSPLLRTEGAAGVVVPAEVQLPVLDFYTGLWWADWVIIYEGLAATGVQFDGEKLDLFIRWYKHCPIWLWCANAVYILRRPQFSFTDEQQEPHNETGPAIDFGPEFQIWAIHGITLDEQIVMAPETQTVEQIARETNEDVRAIRIDRFGWPRFLAETHAKLLDHVYNEIEGTEEALYQSSQGHKLVCTDPAGPPPRGKIVCLGVPTDVVDCAQARLWIAGDRPFRILART